MQPSSDEETKVRGGGAVLARVAGEQIDASKHSSDTIITDLKRMS